MKIGLLVSTMNENIIGIDKNYINIKNDININICHQTTDLIDRDIEIEQIKKKININILPMKERGLSKSRNCLLRNATEDIIIISDDDVKYFDNLSETINKYYEKYSEADIITFQVKTPEGDYFKNYKTEPFWHTKKTILKVSSIEVTIKRTSISSKNIYFDEKFGLGSTFPTGEEGIFLNDAINQGLKILYIPVPISIHPLESSGKMFTNNPKLIKSKGAMIYRLYNKIGYLITIYFALRKFKLSNYNFIKFIKLMYQGIFEYKKD